MTIEARVADALTRAGVPAAAPVGVALSGGGDSMALLHALAALGRNLSAVTVDHGLRDVRAEIALCARATQALRVPHQVLRWDWDGCGNLQAAARQGRIDRIARWAGEKGLAYVALGHTRDDQAETVLMRIIRGSGVDGLAAMPLARKRGDVIWLRPLLDVSRDDLRSWLRARRQGWAEDPSNNAPRFDRVRIRQALPVLSELGLTHGRLTQLADHAQAAQRTLEEAADLWADNALRMDRGDVILAQGVPDLGGDSPRRVVAAAVQWVGGGSYRPRWKALRDALVAVRDNRAATIGGCLLTPAGGALRIAREAQACGARVPLGELWDGRWRIVAPAGAQTAECCVGALGEHGLAQCADWRETGLPRASLLASPAIWQGDGLVAAPLADPRAQWRAEVVQPFPYGAFTLNPPR